MSWICACIKTSFRVFHKQITTRHKVLLWSNKTVSAKSSESPLGRREESLFFLLLTLDIRLPVLAACTAPVSVFPPGEIKVEKSSAKLYCKLMFVSSRALYPHTIEFKLAALSTCIQTWTFLNSKGKQSVCFCLHLLYKVKEYYVVSLIIRPRN